MSERADREAQETYLGMIETAHKYAEKAKDFAGKKPGESLAFIALSNNLRVGAEIVAAIDRLRRGTINGT